MSDSDPTDGRWRGNVNDAVREDWREAATTFERVRQVLDVTTEPQSAAEIADRAGVSEPTARKHLESLREVGRAEGHQTDSGRRYVRSPQALAVRRISAIHREHAKDEVRDAIEELREELAALRETHGVADADDLALELAAGDDGWRDVARWRQLEENLEVAQAALALYDFDPDDSRSAPVDGSGGRRREGSRERGALGDETGSVA